MVKMGGELGENSMEVNETAYTNGTYELGRLLPSLQNTKKEEQERLHIPKHSFLPKGRLDILD